MKKSWLDEMCEDVRTVQDGEVISGTIISANAHENRILINVADENGQLIGQVASFNCGTEAGLRLAKQFFGQLVGQVPLRSALVAAKGKAVKITGRRNEEYVNIVLNAPTAPVVVTESISSDEEPAI